LSHIEPTRKKNYITDQVEYIALLIKDLSNIKATLNIVSHITTKKQKELFKKHDVAWHSQ
jgi:hypothetical protein